MLNTKQNLLIQYSQPLIQPTNYQIIGQNKVSTISHKIKKNYKISEKKHYFQIKVNENQKKITILSNQKLKQLIFHRLRRSESNKIKAYQRIMKIKKVIKSKPNQNLLCPLCLELFIHPINTQCGKSFCRNCFQNNQMRPYCPSPSCQKNLRGSNIYPVLATENIIKIQIERLNNKQISEKYKKRINIDLHQQQIKRIKIDELKLRQRIDVQDLDCDWFQAEVLQIKKLKNGQIRYIMIKYKHNQKIEIIQKNKFNRICNSGFYTKQIQISQAMTQQNPISDKFLLNQISKLSNRNKTNLFHVPQVKHSFFRQLNNSQMSQGFQIRFLDEEKNEIVCKQDECEQLDKNKFKKNEQQLFGQLVEQQIKSDKSQNKL